MSAPTFFVRRDSIEPAPTIREAVLAAAARLERPRTKRRKISPIKSNVGPKKSKQQDQLDNYLDDHTGGAIPVTPMQKSSSRCGEREEEVANNGLVSATISKSSLFDADCHGSNVRPPESANPFRMTGCSEMTAPLSVSHHAASTASGPLPDGSACPGNISEEAAMTAPHNQKDLDCKKGFRVDQVNKSPFERRPPSFVQPDAYNPTTTYAQPITTPKRTRSPSPPQPSSTWPNPSSPSRSRSATDSLDEGSLTSLFDVFEAYEALEKSNTDFNDSEFDCPTWDSSDASECTIHSRHQGRQSDPQSRDSVKRSEPEPEPEPASKPEPAQDSESEYGSDSFAGLDTEALLLALEG
jgi:hypothetical protein